MSSSLLFVEQSLPLEHLVVSAPRSQSLVHAAATISRGSTGRFPLLRGEIMNASKLTCVSILASLALSLPNVAMASEWSIDQAHSKIGFSIRHLMVTDVEGHFGEFEGVVKVDDKDITRSKVEVSVKVSSIDTNNTKRDNHLKSGDFFNVEKYEKMTFKSTKIVKRGSKLKIHGKLTLHGVTKPVVLHVKELTDGIKDPWGNTRRGARASAKINRTDFGLKWNQALEAGGVLVGEEVKIILRLALVQKA